MNIVVSSVNCNAKQQLIMAFKRANVVEAELTDEICTEVAREIRLKFVSSMENVFYFEDIQ